MLRYGAVDSLVPDKQRSSRALRVGGGWSRLDPGLDGVGGGEVVVRVAVLSWLFLDRARPGPFSAGMAVFFSSSPSSF